MSVGQKFRSGSFAGDPIVKAPAGFGSTSCCPNVERPRRDNYLETPASSWRTQSTLSIRPPSIRCPWPPGTRARCPPSSRSGWI